MKDDKKTMLINFGCVDLSDPELVEKFRTQKLQSDRVEELLKNHIWHDFEVPDELSDKIELIDFKIFDVDVYKIEVNYISFDVTIEFKFKFLSKEAIKSVRDYQSKNDDLRANSKRFFKTKAQNKIKIAEVDKNSNGVFLFNYFYSNNEKTVLDVWKYTAGWWTANANLTNSTPLSPLNKKCEYALINHCKWNSLIDILPILILGRI